MYRSHQIGAVQGDDFYVEYTRYAGITRISLEGPEGAIPLASQPDLRPAPLISCCLRSWNIVNAAGDIVNPGGVVFPISR